MFALGIGSKRVNRMGGFKKWRWHPDEMYLKPGGEMVYLWRAADQESSLIVTSLGVGTSQPASPHEEGAQRHGSAEVITIERLRSYGVAVKDMGIQNHFNQACKLVDHQTYKTRCSGALAE